MPWLNDACKKYPRSALRTAEGLQIKMRQHRTNWAYVQRTRYEGKNSISFSPRVLSPTEQLRRSVRRAECLERRIHRGSSTTRQTFTTTGVFLRFQTRNRLSRFLLFPQASNPADFKGLHVSLENTTNSELFWLLISLYLLRFKMPIK